MIRATCEECGARLSPGIPRCNLCGWPVDESELSTGDESPSADATSVPLTDAGPYCNACGWQSPPKARFCSQCGERLQELRPAASARPAAGPSERPRKRPANVEAGVTRQVAVIFGLAVLLVVALFMVTFMSTSTDSPVAITATAPEPAATVPLGGSLAERIASLDEAIALDTGSTRLALVREKMIALWQGGRIDLAAETQMQIAEQTGSVEDWETAGNLYYRALDDAKEDPAMQARMATLAVTAYQEVLAQDPGNLDVRTDMATAYLSTGSPMQGVTEIKRVLEEDPDHLSANFNYGLMLLHINRTDKAIEQLERVLDLAPDSSAHYQRASTLIATVRAQGGT